MNVRPMTGAYHQPDALHADTLRDMCIPSGSVLVPEPPFERGELAQAAVDCLCVLVGFLLLVATALSIPVSLFLLFFVSL